MEATLIKRLDNGWPVYSFRRADGKMIATTRFPFDEPALMIAKNAGIELQKLSHENCDEIFGVVNVEKLATEVEESLDFREFCSTSFKLGFNKGMELNKDKVFTLEDMNNAMDWIMTQYFEFHEQPTTGRREYYLKSLQKPTEIKVEIEMEKVVDETKVIGAVKGVKGSGDKITTYKSVPKLDADGCLILKKKEV
jgi:hypothetical protein